MAASLPKGAATEIRPSDGNYILLAVVQTRFTKSAGEPRLHADFHTDCSVTDDGLKQLGRFPALECLVLTRTSVTDRGVDVHVEIIALNRQLAAMRPAACS